MVPFVDLVAQYRSIKAEVDRAVLALLESGQYVLGEQAALFEREFAALVAARHAVGVNSGTSALHLALLAAGVGPGDEVITTPLTFVATAAAIHYVGARPVYVDVEEGSLTLDPAGVEPALTPRTKALLPVHLHGQCADMGPLLEIASRHGLTLIEDAAQAHLADYQGRPAGGLGRLGCFSFYPGKNLGAYGEGGMVVTGDERLAATIRMLRDWGQDRKYHHVLRGYNYRLEGIQAAVLRVKLRHLAGWTAARRSAAQRLDAALAGCGLRLPAAVPGRGHVYHVYAVRSERRDALSAHLGSRGIQTGIHYPIPVHLQPAYRDAAFPEGSFPVAEAAAQRLLSLPIFPELSAEQVAEVAAAVREFAS